MESIKTKRNLILVTIVSLFTLSTTALAIPPVIGDGCLPGDPCYVEPAKPEPTATPQAVVETPKAQPVTTIVIEEDEEVAPYYVTAGAGYLFFEKDEEILNHLTTEVRLGVYRFLDNVSFEVGVGYQPDVRNREHPDAGRFALAGDTESLSYFGDFLFHLTDETEGFDPYLTLGGGIIDYKDALADGHTDVFFSGGAGAFMSLSEDVFVKPDYRVMSVGSDTEVNHKGVVALGLRF